MSKMKQVYEDIMCEKYDLMQYSIEKNIRELAEYCVDYDIYNVDDLIELIENYCSILEKARTNGGKISLVVDDED